MAEFSILERFVRTTLLALVLAGCGSKGAVTLTARIDAPELGVTAGQLASRLTGQFDLVLLLGDVASDATEVSAPTFSVVQGDRSVISPLDLSASEAFPVTVGPGEEKVVHFTVSENEAISEADATALCAASNRISGTMTDTSNGGKPTPAESLPFEASCP